jgi:prepilin peptidase CpaA
MHLEFTPAVWQIWGLTTLTLFMLMAIESDIAEHRIPNVLILLMLLAGLALNAWGPANGREGLLAKFPGALGANVAFWGASTGLIVFLPFYALSAFGAGDVKFLAALGSFLGPVEVLNLALCVLATGGILAVVRMVFRGNSRLIINNIKLILSTKRAPAGRLSSQGVSTADRMPFALAFAGGLLGYSYWRLMGGSLLIHF